VNIIIIIIIIVSLATRLKMTPTQQSAFTQGLFLNQAVMYRWMLPHMLPLIARDARLLVKLHRTLKTVSDHHK